MPADAVVLWPPPGTTSNSEPNRRRRTPCWPSPDSRECLVHVTIIINDGHLGAVLNEYVAYWSSARPHRLVQLKALAEPPQTGKVVGLGWEDRITSTSGRHDHRYG